MCDLNILSAQYTSTSCVRLFADLRSVSPAGPKGVINDWRKYKQLENEQRVEQQKEMERLIKKLSMTCKSHLDEEADEQKQKELQDKIAGKVRNTQQPKSYST